MSFDKSLLPPGSVQVFYVGMVKPIVANYCVCCRVLWIPSCVAKTAGSRPYVDRYATLTSGDVLGRHIVTFNSFYYLQCPCSIHLWTNIMFAILTCQNNYFRTGACAVLYVQVLVFLHLYVRRVFIA